MAEPLNGAAWRLVVLKDADTLAAAAAEELIATLAEALAVRSDAFVALSGGRTPERLYSALLEPERLQQVDWRRVHFFWSDERAVPPGHPESNYGLADRTLLATLRPAGDRVHRMEAERPDRASAAADYEATVRRLLPGGPSNVPRFDVVLLGLGADGHTASLFPGEPSLDEPARLVIGSRAPASEAARLTFTFPLINAGRCVMMLVSGHAKGGALRALVADGEPPGPLAIPARRIAPREGRFVILADADAAEAASDAPQPRRQGGSS